MAASAFSAGVASPPIIQAASVSREAASTLPCPVMRPRRSTVTSSQTPKTSRNLCVIMSTEISPAVAIAFRRPSTSSASSGVSTEVGSSRIRKRRFV